jgi:hypothetical protein
MCDPVTALTAGAALFSAYGSFSASQSQASALKANAAADLQTGYQNELAARDSARTKLASQLASLSGRGVDVSTGTPLELLRASARNQEIDALNTRADGINKYNSQRAQASGVLKSGYLTAGGQLLMGAASTAKLGGLGNIGKTPLGAAPAPSWAGGDSYAGVG